MISKVFLLHSKIVIYVYPNSSKQYIMDKNSYLMIASYIKLHIHLLKNKFLACLADNIPRYW